jgi:hypothetical protein
VWLADPQLRGVDGLSVLADGALYANNVFNGKLSRIPVKEDGTAGPIVAIKTSVPFSRPDGMRASGPKSLPQVEGRGGDASRMSRSTATAARCASSRRG